MVEKIKIGRWHKEVLAFGLVFVFALMVVFGEKSILASTLWAFGIVIGIVILDKLFGLVFR